MKAAIALLATVLIAGCSSSEATSAPPSTTSPSTPASSPSASTAPPSLDPARANDPLVCAAVNTLGLPQAPADPSDPQLQQTHLAWSLYFGQMVAYLDQNMPTFRGMVNEADPAKRAAERQALVGVEKMRKVAEEGSQHTAGDPPTAAEVNDLENILDAFASATIDVCPSFATS